WEPVPGLRFNFAGGYEDTALAKGSQAIDLMDRTAGNPAWMVVKPFPTETSNCILPTAVVNQLISAFKAQNGGTNPTPVSTVYNTTSGNQQDGLYFSGDGDQALVLACFNAYSVGVDPGSAGAIGINSGFDPATAPNNGEGFAKNLTGNK